MSAEKRHREIPHEPARPREANDQQRAREGWVALPVEHLPEPTYWPAGLALAITFIFWSVITSWVILVVGVVMFIVSLAGWIRDIRHERAHHARPH